MKTKISVTILKHGKHNQDILLAVTSHNEGICTLCPADLISFANVKRAIYPALYKNLFDIGRIDGQEDELFVSDDNGQTYTIILEFREVHELTQNGETDRDDLKGIFETPETDKP